MKQIGLESARTLVAIFQQLYYQFLVSLRLKEVMVQKVHLQGMGQVLPKSGPFANFKKLDISLWGVFRPYLKRSLAQFT